MSDELIIEVKNLTKKYKDLLAVNNLNLNVQKGDVFGFLGPNGAGKSTTIRMLLTLIHRTKGEIKIFGKDLDTNRIEILSNIGAIVEKPDMYGYLTAYKNLEIFGRISKTDVSKHRIMEILELVGLEKRASSKVKTFSHGMKQRLGIAQALLHNPELIILDEPTTGLDPQGMKEIRDLILHLSKIEKKTIFLSSHILHEIELIASRMVIINKGQAVVEGSVKELLDSASLNVKIEVDDVEKAKSVLSESNLDLKIEDTAGNTLIIFTKQEFVSGINKQLVNNGVAVSSLVPSRSLEEYFLSLTR